MSSSIEVGNKSFLQRPEGKVGLAVSGLVLVACAYALYRALPALITLAENMLQLAALCGALGLLFYVVADGKVRSFVAYLYKASFRLLTGFFIEIDPIGILRQHIG